MMVPPRLVLHAYFPAYLNKVHHTPQTKLGSMGDFGNLEPRLRAGLKTLNAAFNQKLWRDM
jgi:hypothetical protein